MNRREKIIVSITGITIVSLFLIALTYGYYVTKIKGNSNSKSITATTDNLELVYGDDDGSIIGAGQLITPNTTFEPKTFSVENKGKSTVEYSVVLDNVSITNASSGDETKFESNDFVYTLTCTSGCNGVSTETTLPLYNNGILVSNSIDEGEKQTYSITITYKDTGKDQSDDMNKSLSARINIIDIRGINPYSSNTKLLAYNIINNAKLNKNGTELKAIPDTTPAVQVSSETEKLLSVTPDDYGTSYYYRGNVKNNYLSFNNMCWRIVRIEGDGSIKLVLEDYNTTCNSSVFTGDWSDGSTYRFGGDGNSKVNYLNYSGGLADAFKTFQTSKLSVVLDKLKVDEWCYDDTVTGTYSYGYDDNYNQIFNQSEAINGWYTDEYYGSYTRLVSKKQPSLNCTGTKLTKFKDGTDMYVGTLTADEIVLAGGTTSSSNTNYYLINNYQKNNSIFWWSLSPDKFTAYDGYGCAFFLKTDGSLSEYYTSVMEYYYARPSINLKSGIEIIGGDGTQENPYTIK